jgi:predicted CXXCH cytochrome family protein
MTRSRLVIVALGLGLAICSCADRGSFHVQRTAVRDVQRRHALNLGALRTGRRPSDFETRLAEFLFGEAPAPPMGFIKPVDLVARAGQVLVCDAGYRGILHQTAAGSPLSSASLHESPTVTAVISDAPDGGLLVGDAATGRVSRYSSTGQFVQQYTAPEGMRVGGIAVVGQEVWVSNIALGRIEVFDFSKGEHLRSVSRRGSGPGEFGAPLGIAVMADGNVCVVDVLGARVRVFDKNGQWLRDIGAPGDGPGLLGRPKDVAVGRDGVVFVTDAASRRVHAFRPNGEVIASFGDSGPDALAVPAGIAVSGTAPEAERATASGFEPDYYLLVAEQLARPGVRVFAWRVDAPRPVPTTIASLADTPLAPNPHWRPDRCVICHSDRAKPHNAIAAEDADALCLSCHDGRKAGAEAHPIGRLAHGVRTNAPADWPLVDERLSCLTCHDVKRHCGASAARPAVNPAMVRGFDAEDAMASCRVCHQQQMTRFNPHEVSVQTGENPVGCRVCHGPLSAPKSKPGDDMPNLRQPASRLCVNCHTPHADPAPGGHPGLAARGVSRSWPLEDGRVTCATCHNPHAAKANWRGRAIGARATAADDDRIALRANYAELCRACHPK